MLAVTVVVCAGVALVRVAIGLAAALRARTAAASESQRRAAELPRRSPPWLALAVRRLGGPGELSDRWEEFKQPAGPEDANTAERFESASGNGRYQYWQAAVDANATDPLIGIGPGTYEYFWAEDGSLPGFVRDAHSLFFETLAELGIVGLLLIGGLVFGVVGVRRRRRSSALKESTRPWLAAATAACIAFAAAAAIDWVWELAVIPVVFLLLAAGPALRAAPSAAPAAARSPLARPALGRARSPRPGRDRDPARRDAARSEASQAEVDAGRLGPRSTTPRGGRHPAVGRHAAPAGGARARAAGRPRPAAAAARAATAGGADELADVAGALANRGLPRRTPRPRSTPTARLAR